MVVQEDMVDMVMMTNIKRRAGAQVPKLRWELQELQLLGQELYQVLSLLRKVLMEQKQWLKVQLTK